MNPAQLSTIPCTQCVHTAPVSCKQQLCLHGARSHSSIGWTQASQESSAPVDVQQDCWAIVLVPIPPAAKEQSSRLWYECSRNFAGTPCQAAVPAMLTRPLEFSSPVGWAGGGAAGTPAGQTQGKEWHGRTVKAGVKPACKPRQARCCRAPLKLRRATGGARRRCCISAQTHSRQVLPLTGCTRTACPGGRGPPCSAGTPFRPCGNQGHGQRTVGRSISGSSCKRTCVEQDTGAGCGLGARAGKHGLCWPWLPLAECACSRRGCGGLQVRLDLLVLQPRCGWGMGGLRGATSVVAVWPWLGRHQRMHVALSWHATCVLHTSFPST